MPRFLLPLLLILLLLPGAGTAAENSDGPHILAGTGIAADILRDLTGPGAQIRQLIPGGACPGHYDLRPGDLLFLKQADLLVLESYQPSMANMGDLVRAADNARLRIVVLPKEADAMLPKAQIAYTEILAAKLGELFPALNAPVAEAASRRIAKVREVAAGETARLKAAKNVPALCAAMQAGFASWAGLTVVGTYGRPEDMSPKAFARLLDMGKKNHVRMVLDNLQSGPGTGNGLAESLGAGHADLTSFPGALPGQDDWASAFSGNTQNLLNALKEAGK